MLVGHQKRPSKVTIIVTNSLSTVADIIESLVIKSVMLVIFFNTNIVFCDSSDFSIIYLAYITKFYYHSFITVGNLIFSLQFFK